MRNYFMFNGKNIADFDAYVYHQDIYNAPARQYEVIDIPGRNGPLLADMKTFDSVELSYNCLIYRDFEQNISALKMWLSQNPGKHRLEDTYNPDEYYNAYYTGGLEITDADRSMGKFVLTFSRDPQRFLKSGEAVKSSTSSLTLYNFSQMAAKPLFRLYGNGVLTVNGKTITVAGNTADYVDIDCDAMEIYNGTTDLSAKVTLQNHAFPVLDQFENTVSITSGITKFDITPRWWRL